MKIGSGVVLSLTLAALIDSQPVLAAPLSCPRGIVDERMTMAEVLAKCGEPTDKGVEDVPVYGPGANRRGTILRGTTRIEYWTYDRGYGRFQALLTFEEGRLQKIELLTGR